MMIQTTDILKKYILYFQIKNATLSRCCDKLVFFRATGEIKLEVKCTQPLKNAYYFLKRQTNLIYSFNIIL